MGEALIVVIAAAEGIVAAVIEGISLTNTIFTAPNPALNLAPFSRWTLRDKAAQRRLALLRRTCKTSQTRTNA